MQYPENSKKGNMAKKHLNVTLWTTKAMVNLSYLFYVLLYLKLIIFENHKRSPFTRILTRSPESLIQQDQLHHRPRDSEMPGACAVICFLYSTIPPGDLHTH